MLGNRCQKSTAHFEWDNALLALIASLVLATTTSSAAIAAQGEAVSEARELAGVWWIKDYQPKINSGATFVVFTPEGRAAYDRNLELLQAGALVDRARTQCMPDGIPRIMASPYPFEIILAPEEISFRFEVNNTERVVELRQTVPSLAELTPTELGHSYGRWDQWEGNTLIVESTGFTATTFLDASGLPHSDQLYVKEYFWTSDNGAQLEYVALIFDPVIYSQVWGQRYSFELQVDIEIRDYDCGGINRDVSHIPGIDEWNQ